MLEKSTPASVPSAGLFQGACHGEQPLRAHSTHPPVGPFRCARYGKRRVLARLGWEGGKARPVRHATRSGLCVLMSNYFRFRAK